LKVLIVSIPSRGFWFFEAKTDRNNPTAVISAFQSPHGDFGFLKIESVPLDLGGFGVFQSPHGDFGFLKPGAPGSPAQLSRSFQSPHGDFGFLKLVPGEPGSAAGGVKFQSPHGDFGFLKASDRARTVAWLLSFNPLTGILVF